MPRGSSKRFSTDRDARALPVPPPGQDQFGRPKVATTDFFDLTRGGLCLRISSTGLRTWCVYCRLGRPVKPRPGDPPLPQRRLKRVTLGTFLRPGSRTPVIGLAEARQIADQVRALAERGIDYAEQQRARALEEARQNELAFEKVAVAFIENYAKPNQPRSWRECERYIIKHMVGAEGSAPIWRGRVFTSITRADVIAMRDAVAEHGHVASNRALAHARRLFTWAYASTPALAAMPLDANPFARDIEPVLRRERVRERVLNDDELRAIMQALDAEEPVWQHFGWLLLWTAARRRNVAEMRWSAIDFNRTLWRLTSLDMKAGQAWWCPLPRQALGLLKTLNAERDAANDLVLPAAEGGVLTAFSDFKARIDAASGVTGWVWHDTRRSLRSRGEDDLGLDGGLLRLCLAHARPKGDADAKHYAMSERLEPRRKVLQTWADALDRVRAGGPLRPVKRTKRKADQAPSEASATASTADATPPAS